MAAQPLIDDRLDNTFNFAVAQLRLRLPFELRIRQFDTNHSDKAFADIVSREVLFNFFEEIVRDGITVQRSSEGRLEADHMRAAFVRVDVVGERKDLLL